MIPEYSLAVLVSKLNTTRTIPMDMIPEYSHAVLMSKLNTTRIITGKNTAAITKAAHRGHLPCRCRSTPSQARTILSASTDKLQEAHLTEGEVLGRLAQQLDALVAFCAAYVAPHVPGSGGAPQGARLDMGPGGGQQAAGPAFCRVHEVVDIEESIWAPKYGLKGQLDATLRVTVATQDPLHNQRTLAGGYASSLQQQQGRGLASQGGWGADGGGGPPRYHGGQQLQRQQHGRLSDGGLQPMGGPKSQAQGGQGAVAAEARGQVRRQSSWSAGAAPLLPPQAPVHGQQQQQQQGSLPGFSCESMIVPFEFKSGKDHCSHRAQVRHGAKTMHSKKVPEVCSMRTACHSDSGA